MKIVVTNAYYYHYDSKQIGIGQPYPPLGTLYAVAMLREDHEVTFYDQNLKEDHTKIFQVLEEVKPDLLLVYDDGFNYLTKMCLTKMRDATQEILTRAQSNGITTIMHSSDATDHFMDYHDHGADYIIHGEGEITLIELVNALIESNPVALIQGISYLDQGTATKTLERKVLKDLDSLPMAAWDLIDIEAYRTVWHKKHDHMSLNIATTRGCPFKCNWCAKPIYGNRYNSRSPQRVLEEINYLMETYNVDYFWMCDDIFGLKPGWVQEFNTLAQEANLKFRYKIQSRADLLLENDNLKALAESGADTVWIGAESGSQKILDAMDKGTKVEQIFESAKKLRSQNIKTGFFLQFGYPGETWTDIKSTIRMVLDLMPDDIGISVSYPLPGTKFYDTVAAEMTKKNWTDSDDLDLMFSNTYAPLFYKTLHRYVHHRYRIKSGWLRIKKLQLFRAKHIRDIVRMIYHLPLSAVRYFSLRRQMSIG